MSAIEDRERVRQSDSMYVDISRAANSADAVRQLESALGLANVKTNPGLTLDINTGDLLLTPGILTKIQALVKRFGVRVNTLYSLVPQTQQTALDEGLMVRRQPLERKKFTPGPFLNSLVKDEPKDLDTKLLVTLEDGSREEVPVSQDVSTGTVYYRQTLRSGQLLEATGNIVVVGDAHSGSEILADGDILVWGFLGGIAHAGRKGNREAQIRAVRIEAVQLRIADLITRRPDRLFKQSQNKRGPEVAKVKDDEIQIFEDIVS